MERLIFIFLQYSDKYLRLLQTRPTPSNQTTNNLEVWPTFRAIVTSTLYRLLYRTPRHMNRTLQFRPLTLIIMCRTEHNKQPLHCY
jgi:hypothetical protein